MTDLRMLGNATHMNACKTARPKWQGKSTWERALIAQFWERVAIIVFIFNPFISPHTAR